MSAARSRGTSFETALMRYLRENGFDVERLRQAGAQDEGDLVVKDGGVTIIEAKATRRLDTASGVREALAEKVNYAKHRGLDPDDITGVMVWKVPGKSIADALVIVPLREFFDIPDVNL